jgi:hypothetical protein
MTMPWFLGPRFRGDERSNRILRYFLPSYFPPMCFFRNAVVRSQASAALGW